MEKNKFPYSNIPSPEIVTRTEDESDPFLEGLVDFIFLNFDELGGTFPPS